MKKILNITNSDLTVDLLSQAKIAGDFLPWQDMLYTGPVPIGLTLRELSTIRAWFIAKQGWLTKAHALKKFKERNAMLFNFSEYDQVILWFGNDLYDQLQLIQVLDWLIKHEWGKTRITIICEDSYLGSLSNNELNRIQQTATSVTSLQALLAEKAWKAFRAKTPNNLMCLIDEPTDDLPFLRNALIRLMEEYPRRNNGLSRTEQQILQIIANGVSNPIAIFNQSQALEAHPFIEDIVFWTKINHFVTCDPPLLNACGGMLSPTKMHRQTITITDLGQAVLNGRKNFLELIPSDHWLGGVHFHKTSPYCF